LVFFIIETNIVFNYGFTSPFERQGARFLYNCNPHHDLFSAFCPWRDVFLLFLTAKLPGIL